MIDDPARHEAGLAKWIGQDSERLGIYNRVARAMKAATWSANQLYERQERAPPRRLSLAEARWVMALVLLGLAAAAIGIAHLVSPSTQPDMLVPTAEAFDAPANAERVIKLADGSEVTLRPGSHVDTRFSRADRRIFLSRGSARFQVAHNAGWPFVVNAGGGTVTAKGTVFEVTIGPDVSVRLLEGAVDVALPSRPPGKPVIRHLVPGAETHFFASEAGDGTGIESQGVVAAKRSDMKSFDDVPVREVIDEVNRASPVRIELADTDLGEQRVVLDLHVGDAEDVADGLAAYLGLLVDRSRPGILLLRQPARH